MVSLQPAGDQRVHPFQYIFVGDSLTPNGSSASRQRPHWVIRFVRLFKLESATFPGIAGRFADQFRLRITDSQGNVLQIIGTVIVRRDHARYQLGLIINHVHDHLRGLFGT